MAKTIVTAKHQHGPHENGYDGCHARWTEGGMCPGVKMAEWLNALGEDDEIFGTTRLTNGEVRDNYLRSYRHVTALNPKLAALEAERRDLSARLRQTNARIKQVHDAHKVATRG